MKTFLQQDFIIRKNIILEIRNILYIINSIEWRLKYGIYQIKM